VIVSNSGATCVMAADAASQAAMPLAALGDATQAGLRAVLPAFAATANPIDITAALLTNSRLFSEILPVIAADPAVDACLIGVPVAGAAYDVPAFARDAAAFGVATGKPLVVAAPQTAVAAEFTAAGLPVYPYETQAIAALDGFLRHHDLMARASGAPSPLPVQAPAPGPSRALNEADSLALLARAGVAVVAHRLCHSEDAAIAAAEIFGGPIVLKGCSADVTHKSEHDLVRLGLTGADAIRAAFRDCRRILLERGFRFDGVLVAAMTRGRREMLIGAHRDPVFGPVVVIGDGGKYVEAMPDTTMLLPPFTPAEVEAALARLRIAPILRGVRGEPALDVPAFRAAAIAVGRLMLEDATLAGVDINPLLLDVEGCVAVDAVVLRNGLGGAAEADR
jgi:acyl-CoA synthetase (NDP forming)